MKNPKVLIPLEEYNELLEIKKDFIAQFLIKLEAIKKQINYEKMIEFQVLSNKTIKELNSLKHAHKELLDKHNKLETIYSNLKKEEEGRWWKKLLKKLKNV